MRKETLGIQKIILRRPTICANTTDVREKGKYDEETEIEREREHHDIFTLSRLLFKA